MKAILVIDLPDKDYAGREIIEPKIEYKVFNKVGFNELGYFEMGIHGYELLKPMPQRKIVGEIKKVDDFMKSDIQIINEKVTASMILDTELLLASGYNLCIDEISGEKE